LRAKALPSWAIDLHLQSADIDFIAAKTRSAVASGNGARTGVDQIVAPSEAPDLRGFVNRLSPISQSR
jgi:hypothetical protein